MGTKGMQVFIVDDEPSFGKSLKRMLDGNGYAAHCFDSSQTFLDSVPSGQVGIAIIDLHMPGIDGFALMDTMRAMHYAMPVIIVTGQTQGDTRDLAMRRGATGFLQKPFTERSLLESIESGLDRQGE
jgi:FixJ family two-component response regulator